MPGEEHSDHRNELDAVLTSELFKRSPNLANILRYIGEKHFGGQSHEIKEYNIAIEALGRPAEFDPTRESLVRVEAHRLRKRLAQYYRQEGFQHRFQIVIPPGSYTPQFVERVNGHTAVTALEPPSRPRRWYVLYGVILLVLGVAGTVFFRLGLPMHAGAPRQAAAPGAAPAVSFPPGVRILAGLGTGDVLDSYGNTWGADRFFKGGEAQSLASGKLAYARDTSMFQHRRRGSFNYDIPLAAGFYELHLYFAETFFGEENESGGGEASRLFGVRANGHFLLRDFDVLSDAGGSNTADIKVFKNMQPAPDGLLHLEFVANRDLPFVNAIEILPSREGAMLPVRILARELGYIDAKGRIWSADRYYRGGRLVKRPEAVADADEPSLYHGERFGNFSYAIPVAQDGRYMASLRFSEQWFGPSRPGGAGSRLFDVLLNGRTLLGNFDVFKETGSVHALTKTFRGLRPNAQGKLVFSFVPISNYAIVDAVEVVDEAGK